MRNLKEAADLVAKALGVSFALHDSLFRGGDYFRAEVEAGTISVEGNVDLLDGEPFDADWPSDHHLLRFDGTDDEKWAPYVDLLAPLVEANQLVLLKRESISATGGGHATSGAAPHGTERPFVSNLSTTLTPVGTAKLCLCIAAIAWLFWPTRPALLRIGEPGAIRGEVLLFLANPLRDRAPEATAEHFLHLLQQGRCLEAFRFAGGRDDARIKETCHTLARQLPLIRWKFIDRVDQGGIVHLQYHCRLQKWDEYLSVQLRKSDGEWRILSWAFPPGA